MTSIPKTKPIKAIFLIGMIDANLILGNFTFVILQMTIYSHLAYEKHNNYALLKKIKLSVVELSARISTTSAVWHEVA